MNYIAVGLSCLIALTVLPGEVVCQVFMEFSSNGKPLGRITISMTGQYSNRTRQFMQLIRGGPGQDRYKGAHLFGAPSDGGIGQYLNLGHYKTGDGHTQSDWGDHYPGESDKGLFPTEGWGDYRVAQAGDVIGRLNDRRNYVGVHIYTNSSEPCDQWNCWRSGPLIGKVTSGLDEVAQSIAWRYYANPGAFRNAHAWLDWVKTVTISDCGEL